MSPLTHKTIYINDEKLDKDFQWFGVGETLEETISILQKYLELAKSLGAEKTTFTLTPSYDGTKVCACIKSCIPHTAEELKRIEEQNAAYYKSKELYRI